MKQNHLKRRSMIGMAACLAMVACAAHAGTYTFTQTGFNDNTSIAGFFQGEDSNHDGKITSDEISNFGATVTGGYFNHFEFGYISGFPGFDTHLAYTLGSGTIGAMNDDSIDTYATAFIGYVAGHAGGRIYGFDSEPVFTTSEIAKVVEPSPVPEPAGYAMLLAGLVLLPWLGKRKKAA